MIRGTARHHPPPRSGGPLFTGARAILTLHFRAPLTANPMEAGGGSSDDVTREARHARRSAAIAAVAALDGEHVSARRIELRRLAEAHFGRGLSESSLADQLDVDTRTVGRWLKKVERLVLARARALGIVEDGR